MASDGPQGKASPGRYSAISSAVGRAVRSSAESDVAGAKPKLKVPSLSLLSFARGQCTHRCRANLDLALT